MLPSCAKRSERKCEGEKKVRKGVTERKRGRREEWKEIEKG